VENLRPALGYSKSPSEPGSRAVKIGRLRKTFCEWVDPDLTEGRHESMIRSLPESND
jgi:hypothetical protein